MDTRPLCESDNVTVDLVTNSPTKKLVILSGGSMQPDQEGRPRFGLMVEIDGKNKIFRPNKTTLTNIQSILGFESQDWIGKTIVLSVGVLRNKAAIIGHPEVSKKPVQNF